MFLVCIGSDCKQVPFLGGRVGIWPISGKCSGVTCGSKLKINPSGLRGPPGVPGIKQLLQHARQLSYLLFYFPSPCNKCPFGILPFFTYLYLFYFGYVWLCSGLIPCFQLRDHSWHLRSLGSNLIQPYAKQTLFYLSSVCIYLVSFLAF